MDQYGYLDEADGCAAGLRSHRHQLELARAFLETHRGENSADVNFIYQLITSINVCQHLLMSSILLGNLSTACTFSLVFHVRLGHTRDLNDVSVLDGDVAAWLQEIHAAGLARGQLVLVAGDHGNRCSGYNHSYTFIVCFLL